MSEGRPFLQFTDGDEREHQFFFESASATVGRQAGADLVLDWDEQVSRVHARFERVGDAWEVVDDGISRNGTFVNGQRLSGRRRLNDGDTLRFGGTRAVFRAGSAAPRPAVPLSTTQRRVLTALCRPYREQSMPASDEAIAEELFLSPREVKQHLQVLYAKLGIGEGAGEEARMQLAHRAVADGLVPG